MSIKDILLYLDEGRWSEGALSVALELARDHGAALTGISILTHDYYQPQQLRAQENMSAAGEFLRKRALEAEVPASWRCIESTVVGVTARELLIRNSHSRDLIVIGQEPRRTTKAAAVVEHLVLGVGRPVLVVPSVGVFPTVARHILVAWKNGREATRALNDALPLLKQADQVTLLAVSPSGEARQDPWEGILEHLQRHGINARAELQPATSAPLADSLLNLACEGGYDLLVMGAFYSAPRSGARLGPVAAQILREMTLPVMLSH